MSRGSSIVALVIIALAGCTKEYTASVRNLTSGSISVALIKGETGSPDDIVDSDVIAPGDELAVGPREVPASATVRLEIAAGRSEDALVLRPGKTSADAVAEEGEIKLRQIEADE